MEVWRTLTRLHERNLTLGAQARPNRRPSKQGIWSSVQAEAPSIWQSTASFAMILHAEWRIDAAFFGALQVKPTVADARKTSHCPGGLTCRNDADFAG